jgi:hypothetical protein
MRLVRSCLGNLRDGLFMEFKSLGGLIAFGVSRDGIVLLNKGAWDMGIYIMYL